MNKPVDITTYSNEPCPDCGWDKENGPCAKHRKELSGKTVETELREKAFEALTNRLAGVGDWVFVVHLEDAEATIATLTAEVARLKAEVNRDRDYLCINHIAGGMNEDVDCIACFEVESLKANLDAMVVENHRLQGVIDHREEAAE